MASTSRGYPYPTNADAPNGPAQMQALASAVDADVAALEQSSRLKVYYKAAATSRASTITPTDDPDLSGIALGTGLYRVSMFLHTSGAAAADVRWALTFSGTLSGELLKSIISTDASATTDVRGATVGMITSNFATENYIGTDGSRVGNNYVDALLNVTGAGTLALQWAQLASSATASVLNAGSRIYVERCS